MHMWKLIKGRPLPCNQLQLMPCGSLHIIVGLQLNSVWNIAWLMGPPTVYPSNSWRFSTFTRRPPQGLCQSLSTTSDAIAHQILQTWPKRQCKCHTSHRLGWQTDDSSSAMVLLPKAPEPKENGDKPPRNVFFESDGLDHMAKHFVGNNIRLVWSIHSKISRFGCIYWRCIGCIDITSIALEPFQFGRLFRIDFPTITELECDFYRRTDFVSTLWYRTYWAAPKSRPMRRR